MFELCRDTCIYFYYGVVQSWFEQCFGDCGKWFVSGAEEEFSLEMAADEWPSQDMVSADDAEKKTFRQRLYELCRDTCQQWFFGVQQQLFENCMDKCNSWFVKGEATPEQIAYFAEE